MEKKILGKLPITLQGIMFGMAVGLILGSFVGIYKDKIEVGLIFGFITAFLNSICYLLTKENKSLILILFSLIATAFFIIIYNGGNSHYLPPLQNKQIPFSISENLRRWAFMADLLRIIHILLGFIGILFSLLVALKIKRIEKYIRYFGLISALSFGILTAYDVGDKANRTRKAWRLLNTAVLRYETQQDYTINQLIDVYIEGENIVGDVKPDPR